MDRGAPPPARDPRPARPRMRGPGVMPARLGEPALRTARERFDDLVLGIVTEVDARWQERLGLVEYAVEDAPMLPDDWGDATVPLSSLVRGTGGDADPAGAVPPPHRAPVRGPRRPRGDGADHRRRAGRRAARAAPEDVDPRYGDRGWRLPSPTRAAASDQRRAGRTSATRPREPQVASGSTARPGGPTSTAPPRWCAPRPGRAGWPAGQPDAGRDARPTATRSRATSRPRWSRSV